MPYTSGYERFVVSPDNARERLARFIEGARKQLLIYDPQATDDAMLRLVTRAREGRRRRPDHRQARSEVGDSIKNEKYPGKRLHIRAIIRDGKRAFMGSQSLRRLELEKRREVGVIVTDEARRPPDAGGVRERLGADDEREEEAEEGREGGEEEKRRRWRQPRSESLG